MLRAFSLLNPMVATLALVAACSQRSDDGRPNDATGGSGPTDYQPPSCPQVEASCERLNEFLDEQPGCVVDDNYAYGLFECPWQNSCADDPASSSPRALEACDAEVAAMNDCQVAHFTECSASGAPDYDSQGCLAESFATYHCYVDKETLYDDVFKCGPPIGISGSTCDCASTSCCGLGSACFDDFDCYSLNSCSYYEDADTCRAKFPSAAAKWDAYVECASTACETCEDYPVTGGGGSSGTGGSTGNAGSASGGTSAGGTSAGGTSGGELCTPKGGTCEDSGDCACGEGCLKTSNCESCSMYCVKPCDKDQDCIDWSKGLTPESQYTSCHMGGLFGYCQ